ncbi:hypothetical protein G6F56_006918 [Rhizopus delemar]|nr:hypothetical protein G6F56_006918 [Rhizopus delemar]
MHTSNRGRGRGSYSQVFRNNNGPLENKNLDRALGEALYNSNNSNSNNNNYNTGRGRGRGQNNRTYRSNNNKGPNRQTFNKKQQQTSIPPVNESFVKKKQTQAQADRAARFGSSSKSEIYAQLKKDRIIEREQAIKNGLIPDPNTPRRLEDAIDFRGICQTKCPQFEMVERDIQNSVDRLEMDEEGNLDKNKAVKAYRRSAAGNDQPLPADVRSPEALINLSENRVQEIEQDITATQEVNVNLQVILERAVNKQKETDVYATRTMKNIHSNLATVVYETGQLRGRLTCIANYQRQQQGNVIDVAERIREYSQLLEEAIHSIQSRPKKRVSLPEIKQEQAPVIMEKRKKSIVNNNELYKHRIIRKRVSNLESSSEPWLLPQKGLRILLSDSF